MNGRNDTLQWLEAHRDLGYALIRIYLGVALLVRGWLILIDPSEITRLAGIQTVYWWYSYLIGAHMIGGLMLAAGFLTRWAALAQIPILVGAVFFIHLEKGLMTVGQSLEVASLVLALLVVFTLFGGGNYSVDRRMAKRQEGGAPGTLDLEPA